MSNHQSSLDWKCNNGHILGQVTTNGSHHKRLELYRMAIDQSIDAVEVDVITVVSNDSKPLPVRCSICGEVRLWAPDENKYQ